jgi:hypothetical protein
MEDDAPDVDSWIDNGKQLENADLGKRTAANAGGRAQYKGGGD